MLLRYKLHQHAFVTRVRAGGVIKIQTARRILENKLWTPRGARRSAVTAIFQEPQLKFQAFQYLVIGMGIKPLPPPWAPNVGSGSHGPPYPRSGVESPFPVRPPH